MKTPVCKVSLPRKLDSEFIREAIRDKVKDLETEEALMRLDKLSGSSKRLTTKEQMRKAKKEAFEALASRYA